MASDIDEHKKRFGNLTFDELIRALYIGYEIEQTPEENVAEQYRNRSELFERFGNSEDFGVMKGIEIVAKAFGLKIEGVDVK